MDTNSEEKKPPNRAEIQAEIAFQDCYLDDLSHCYGCGRLNEHGLKLKSYWQGDESIAYYDPKPYHTAVPGYVYGGLLASLIDCHGTGTAAAAASRMEKHGISHLGEPVRFLTASLSIKYIRPTPIGCRLELRGRLMAIKSSRVTVEVSVYAQQRLTVKGVVEASRVPKKILRQLSLAVEQDISVE